MWRHRRVPTRSREDHSARKTVHRFACSSVRKDLSAGAHADTAEQIDATVFPECFFFFARGDAGAHSGTGRRNDSPVRGTSVPETDVHDVGRRTCPLPKGVAHAMPQERIRVRRKVAGQDRERDFVTACVATLVQAARCAVETRKLVMSVKKERARVGLTTCFLL